MNNKKRSLNSRHYVQLAATVLSNGYLLGFVKGKIYNGNSKMVCVPGLNCYSCPGAVGSCPIGALQAVLGGNKHNFSYYIIGTIMLFGVLLGRFICGFLCPFGFVQDMLYKIPTRKFNIPKKVDKPMRWLKYVIALVMVILLPIFLTNQFGIASPYFCKWICPVGSLEGGIPLVSTNPSLHAQLGFLFNWKMFLLLFTVVSSIFIYRPFCKYICPLGAFYSLFNKYSFYQLHLDKLKCTDCKACEKQCKMNVEVTKNINSLECIRCGDCKNICPTSAISSGFNVKKCVKNK